jgi:signal transduction histidine kinase
VAGMIKDYIYIVTLITLIIAYIALFKNLISERKYFIETLSHDFRVAILAQIRALDFLQNKCSNKNIETELISELNQSSTFSLELLNTLINTYKYKNNEKFLNYESFDLKEVVNKIYDKFSKQINSKNLKFYFDFNGFIPTNADKNELYKVIETFFLTAICNANKNSIITIKVENKKKLEFSIVYDGIKLSDEEIRRMFNNNSNFSVVGHGIKLHLCKNIINFHNGKIDVYITKTNNTCISFTIPARIEKLNNHDNYRHVLIDKNKCFLYNLHNSTVKH